MSSAQPAQGVGPYDEWLREHRVTAEARLVLAYDGRLLRYRKVLEGPELRKKLGVERLVGDEVAVEVAEEELSDLVTSLGLSEGEASRLKSGGTVEVLSVPYAGACTWESDPPTWWDQYPYPKYS
ncbi:MAG: hypothetical protein QI223_07230, partial [Candidatus Korarchaeota archaeon]|nr:hypothetical protein [Candidatus Korarchaeota archaeon]